MSQQQDSRIDRVKQYLLQFQHNMCQALEQHDSSTFLTESWSREQGGGGQTCVLEDGDVIEKAGVNFSHVFGEHLPKAATDKRPNLVDAPFQALGVSVIVHPRNPFAPTSHANLRFFIATPPDAEPVWWFGGGFDLTPYYAFDNDCIEWHQHAKAACDELDPHLYAYYKDWCDQYFYLPHRQEARGIGGLFFDDLNDYDFESCFAFIKSVGHNYLTAYYDILERRCDHFYQQRHRDFQCYRRGRYVEFNLLYDRGTLFGLQSGGRTESILVSMPPQVCWRYNWQPEPDTPEYNLVHDYLIAQDWLSGHGS